MNLLEHAIEATTWPGDIVLDCFAGSGNTAFAALRLGRRTISVELAPQWVAQIALKLDYAKTLRFDVKQVKWIANRTKMVICLCSP